jgi:hypothetical protein
MFSNTLNNVNGLNDVSPYVVGNVGFNGADNVKTTLSGVRLRDGRSPDVPGSPSGRQPERRAQGTKPGSPPRRRRPLIDSRDHSGSESMRVTPADTEPSTKPGSKPPQRARRSPAPSLVYPLGSERGRPDGRDHIQLHAVHIQSTCNPLSVHFQSTWGSTYVGPRTWFPMPGDIGESMAFNAGWWKPCRTM